MFILLRLAEDVVTFQTLPTQRRRDIQQTLTQNMERILNFLLNTLQENVNKYQQMVWIPALPRPIFPVPVAVYMLSEHTVKLDLSTLNQGLQVDPPQCPGRHGLGVTPAAASWVAGITDPWLQQMACLWSECVLSGGELFPYCFVFMKMPFQGEIRVPGSAEEKTIILRAKCIGNEGEKLNLFPQIFSSVSFHVNSSQNKNILQNSIKVRCGEILPYSQHREAEAGSSPEFQASQVY